MIRIVFERKSGKVGKSENFVVATYEAARGVYERHGYEFVLLEFKLAGGPERALIEVDRFHG